MMRSASCSPGRRSSPAFPFLLAVALLGILAGCGSPLNRPAPERRFYNIAVSRPETAAPSPDKTVLKVRPMQISPAYQGKDMVYRRDDTRFEADYYNSFFVQPASNLSQQVEQWIGSSGIFGNVVDSTSQVQDTHLLEGMVNELYADFRDRANPKAVLEMQFFLLKNRNESYSVAFSRSYRREAPFPPGFTDAGGLTAAYGQALTAILHDLEGDLRSAK
jgi:cholesterol transport system auxiliary component